MATPPINFAEAATALGISFAQLKSWATALANTPDAPSIVKEKRVLAADWDRFRVFHYLVKERGLSVAEATEEIALRQDIYLLKLELLEELEQARAAVLGLLSRLN